MAFYQHFYNFYRKKPIKFVYIWSALKNPPKRFIFTCSVGAGLKTIDGLKLSYEDLIKQACVTTTNSATTLLTTTASTILEIGKSYELSMTELIVLLEYSNLTNGKLHTYFYGQKT